LRNNFFNNFKHFIGEKDLFDPGDKILLAVSGGVDSVVLAHLLHRAGFRFAIAHCNFQLRGEDSEGDEEFVKQLAKRLEVPIHIERFDTKKYAKQHKVSIQMAARELRYAWFESILQIHGYQYLATAHHKDDLAETVILNLVKGSVLKGLHGILPKNNHIIRPLLWAGKEEILDYAEYKEIRFREDISNTESKYQRNIIRNKVIPILKEINPDIFDTIYGAAGRRYQVETWYLKGIEKIRNSIVLENKNEWKVKISDIRKQEISPEIFFEWIESFDFTYSQVEDLFQGLEQTESKTFLNGQGTFRMIKEREIIIIERIRALSKPEEILVDENSRTAKFKDIVFHFEKISRTEITNIKASETAYLDLKSLQFPLKIRLWKDGDTFKPFGLKGNKKLSDFFTDLKLSVKEKENQCVIVSGSKICWVAGLRVDDRYKVNPASQKVLKISIGN
jgi:tRNA(Ile)-lysidine synthase